MIDCVNEHIHLALRYLIVNTVHSLKSLLSNDMREFVDVKNEADKSLKIKEYSIFLFHLYDILSILLTNLLSSHVDNYRDNIVIESTVGLLITLINYLFDAYSLDKSTLTNTYLDTINVTPSATYSIQYVQKLFEKTLHTFKEICKFNTTIKLNFEKIFEKLSEKPSNKGALVYILNFMFSVVNNEYTIEAFIDILRKTQKMPVIDVYNDLESNLKFNTIRVGHVSDNMTFLQYIVDACVSSNNPWLEKISSQLLLSIQRSYVNKTKDKIFEQICDFLLNSLNNSFNKTAKVNMSILEDKVRTKLNLGN